MEESTLSGPMILDPRKSFIPTVLACCTVVKQPRTIHRNHASGLRSDPNPYIGTMLPHVASRRTFPIRFDLQDLPRFARSRIRHIGLTDQCVGYWSRSWRPLQKSSSETRLRKDKAAMVVGVRLVSILKVRTFFRKKARGYIYKYDKIRIVIADLLLAVVTQPQLTNHGISDPHSAILHAASVHSGEKNYLV